MTTEKLKFKLELFATRWDKAPRAEILINDHIHYNQEITGTEKDPTVIEFEHELSEGEHYNLVINRSGKDTRQTVMENGVITKDQLLHIKSIEIDEIDIGALVYSGVYTRRSIRNHGPLSRQPLAINCRNLLKMSPQWATTGAGNSSSARLSTCGF